MNIIKKLGVFILFLSLWQELIIYNSLPPYILPSPLQIAKIFLTQWPLLFSQSLPTVIETLAGLGGAIILGSFSALLMHYIKFLRQFLKPILLISQALPTFAIAPLLVIWLGYGMSAKIATAILMLYFPITSSFYDGLSRTPSEWLDLAQMLNASRLRLLIYIRLPAAIPDLISGLRIATAWAPMAAVIGEWVGASKGLGFLMLNANARMQIDMMFAALIILIIWSLLLYFSINFILNKYLGFFCSSQGMMNKFSH